MEKAGDVNPLLEAANDIGIDKPQQAVTTDGQTLDFDPENPPMPNRDNSFEGFLGTFGSPARWAGH